MATKITKGFNPLCRPEFNKNGTKCTAKIDTELGTIEYKYELLVEITKEQFEKLNRDENQH